jgi:ABC-2 type transport system permease protein
LGADFDFSSIWDLLVSSGISERLAYVIPITIILMILSFFAYSLIAGILASMTTSAEDFQQVQTPIILICLFGYYLSMLAPTFEGSLFIKVTSYLPFISALISPPLLLIGQISIFDALISIVLLAGTIYLMVKYGMKVYKVGILNYSTTKIWGKMFKAVKD